MIDKMVKTLKDEQNDDDNKKEYCGIQLDSAEDKIKELDRSVSDEETAIAEANDVLANLASDIKALAEGIEALDKSVVESTAQRKAEHDDYKQLMAEDSAKELLRLAKNR